jgi:WD40 repeat protein
LPSLDFVTRLTNDANVTRIIFSPNGDELALAASDHVNLWGTTSWTMRGKLTNSTSVIYAPREGGWWLSSDSRSAGLYDSETGQVLLPLPRGVIPLATSDDGRYLAVSVDARRLQVWDLVEVKKQFRELGIDWESAAEGTGSSP